MHDLSHETNLPKTTVTDLHRLTMSLLHLKMSIAILNIILKTEYG